MLYLSIKRQSSCVCRGENWSQRNLSATSFVPPLHAEREQSCMQEEEGLQRAVEGRAASDEEEEEKGAEVGQCCLVEVKRLIKRLHNCAKGCPSTAARHLLVTQVYLRDNPPKSFGTLPEVRGSSGRAHACAEQTEREVEKLAVTVLRAEGHEAEAGGGGGTEAREPHGGDGAGSTFAVGGEADRSPIAAPAAAQPESFSEASGKDSVGHFEHKQQSWSRRRVRRSAGGGHPPPAAPLL
ncbi:EF-hand and coiled-coil domain-containing protein 1-like [Arapaima gigas]